MSSLTILLIVQKHERKKCRCADTATFYKFCQSLRRVNSVLKVAGFEITRLATGLESVRNGAMEKHILVDEL
jgi:hypothetical protein